MICLSCLLMPNIYLIVSQQLPISDLLASHQNLLILLSCPRTPEIRPKQLNFAEVKFAVVFFFYSLLLSAI